MRIHAIQTGTVAIKQQQVHGTGQGIQRRLKTLLDHAWTDPLAHLRVTEYQSASGWRGQVRGYLPHHWSAWFAPR